MAMKTRHNSFIILSYFEALTFKVPKWYNSAFIQTQALQEYNISSLEKPTRMEGYTSLWCKQSFQVSLRGSESFTGVHFT
jgi:hypothetical protein